MEYTGEGVEALVALVDEMKKSNLILIDKKVKSLLKLLAYYEEFRDVLAYANDGYDYKSDKKNCLILVGTSSVLRLPKTEKDLVAFVSNLLVEFDSGEGDLITFADRYFPSDNKQKSVVLFMQSVIDPFKRALASLVVNGHEDDKVSNEGRVVAFAANGIYEQTESIIVSIVRSVEEADIAPDLRADLLLMLEGEAAALDSKDILFIRSVWCGLKRTLETNKLCSKEIGQIEEQLHLYLVIK